MKSYPSYKDSGIEWIGEIPSHWEVKKLKFIVEFNMYNLSDLFPEENYIYYIDIGNVSLGELINPPLKLKFKDAPSRAKRILRKGDTIISTVRTYLKAITFIDFNQENLIGSTGFTVLSPKKLFDKYLFYLVICQEFIDEICSRSVGVSYPAITSTQIGNIPVLYPPCIKEQTAIADFLDQKTGEIDLAVKKGEERIRLLKEYRGAVIHEAVTRGVPADIAGIDQAVEMKESGIEYIGEIPKHWEVKKLKWLINIKSGKAISSQEISPNGLYPVYGGNGITGYSDSYKFNEEIIVVGRVGAYCGSVYLIEGESWVTDNALIITTDFSNQLLYYILSDMNLNRLASKSAQPLITGSLVKDQFIVYPPTLEEQRQIVEYIETETARLDAEIRTAEEEIRLLQEYREALISEAVTGKIDVRDYPLN